MLLKDLLLPFGIAQADAFLGVDFPEAAQLLSAGEDLLFQLVGLAALSPQGFGETAVVRRVSNAIGLSSAGAVATAAGGSSALAAGAVGVALGLGSGSSGLTGLVGGGVVVVSALVDGCGGGAGSGKIRGSVYYPSRLSWRSSTSSWLCSPSIP